MKKTVGIVVILTLSLLGIGFIAGFQYNSQTMLPTVITNTRTEYKYLPTETIVETVTEIVMVTEEIERLVEIPFETREFETVQELRDYVGSTVHMSLVENTCLSLNRIKYQQCLEDGYQVSMVPLNYREYTTRFENPVLVKSSNWHMVIMAVIGTDIYLYEPQTGEIVHFGRGY